MVRLTLETVNAVWPNEDEGTVYIDRNDKTRTTSGTPGTEIGQRKCGVSLRRHGRVSQGLQHLDPPPRDTP